MDITEEMLSAYRAGRHEHRIRDAHLDGPNALGGECCDRAGLERVAPLIAAQALRRAAEERERSHPCPAETWSWEHFTQEQVDGYWIGCTLSVPHEEHDDEHTGLRWRTDPKRGDLRA